MSREGSILLRWLALLAWAGLIFLASSRPVPEGYVPPVRHFDKVLHAVAYGALAMLCFRALRPGGEPPTPMWVLLAGVVVATVLGAAEEFHQGFVPTRECDVWDMVANGIGAALAAAVWDPLTRKYAALR